MLNIIIIAITTILLGTFLQKSSKYLSFSYNNISIKMPILLVIIGLVTLILLQLWLVKIAIKNWWINKKLTHSIKYSKKAIFLLMAGEPAMAEKTAKKISSLPPFVWLSSLIATVAAKQQRNWENCHEYVLAIEVLMQQHKNNFKDPNELAAIGLLRVELNLQQQQYQKCIYELKKLYRNFPRYKPLIFKLIEVYQATNDWEELIKLLPIIKKYKLYPDSYQQFELNTYINRINQLAATEPVEWLVKNFKSLPKDLKRNNKLFLAYINGLIKLKSENLAEKQLKDYLNNKHADWDPDLVLLYSKLNVGENLNSKIKIVESWLTWHPQDPKLLLALGELCIQVELYGKAKNYLERSLEISTDPACYLLLGKLAGIMGDQAKSLGLYKEGLSSEVKLLK